MSDPRLPRLLAALAALLFAASLVGLASLPTGYSSVRATVPEGRRIAAQAPVDRVQVMVLSTSSRLELLVVYRGDKGWQRIRLDPIPAGTVAAWVATRGSDDVPALSVVFGRAQGTRVAVRWKDGRTNEVAPERDGTYLVARAGRVRSAHVGVLGDDGAVITEVDGP
jgi:hypothetical protein